MEGIGGRPTFQSCGQERRIDVVSGRGYYCYSSNQMYTISRPRSPDLPPVRPEATPAAAAAKPWGFSDPGMKRRRRIARYKVYTVEGRVKASIRNGIRWIKNKCSEIIHGY